MLSEPAFIMYLLGNKDLESWEHFCFTVSVSVSVTVKCLYLCLCLFSMSVSVSLSLFNVCVSVSVVPVVEVHPLLRFVGHEVAGRPAHTLIYILDLTAEVKLTVKYRIYFKSTVFRLLIK